MTERKPFVAGNWKMNMDREATHVLLTTLKESLAGQCDDVDVVVAPPFTSLAAAEAALAGAGIRLSAQTMHAASSGAFTGEISASMLIDSGVEFVILGHSERRQLFGETDEGVRQKVEAALEAGLKPIVCVGETLEQREAGETLAVVHEQLEGALGFLSSEAMAPVVVAYEPVWAIGTGKTASPAQAQEVHASIRALLSEIFGAERSDAVRILYGGSVKPANAPALFAKEDIDGGLVGGASLKADAFAAIISAAL